MAEDVKVKYVGHNVRAVDVPKAEGMRWEYSERFGWGPVHQKDRVELDQVSQDGTERRGFHERTQTWFVSRITEGNAELVT